MALRHCLFKACDKVSIPRGVADVFPGRPVLGGHEIPGARA